MERVPCPPVAGLDAAECATLSVPERWGSTEGRRIELRIAVLPSVGADPNPAALFVLAGGPGQAATELAESIGAEHAGTRRRSDVVLVDQRGAGGSNPLRCETPDPEDSDAELRATAEALQLAVVCPEDHARITEQDVARETPGTFLGEGLIRDYQQICSAWPAAPLPDDYGEPTRSDVPVLLISGEIDPSTPPSFGETAARTLPRSRHVVIPGGTHIHRGACLDRVVEEFLAAADPEVDVACLLESPPPRFFLGDEPAEGAQ